MAEGLAEGRAQGLETGLAEGRAEGRAEGIAEGKNKGRAEVIRQFHSKGMSAEQIADLLDADVADIEKILL
jgi:predicted transposase YdaD